VNPIVIAPTGLHQLVKLKKIGAMTKEVAIGEMRCIRAMAS
jgi:hypothetical protein